MATRIEGLDRLKKRLGRLPARMKAEVRVAMDKSADELVAFQKRLVPVESGDLRDSIQKQEGRHELQVIVSAGDEKAFYAGMVEFGTVNTPAQPFFYPPYRTNRKRIRARISRAVRKAVKANV